MLLLISSIIVSILVINNDTHSYTLYDIINTYIQGILIVSTKVYSIVVYTISFCFQLLINL